MSEREQERGQWLSKLAAEIGGELGQTVTLAAGGEAPEAAVSWTDTIEIPGARVTVAAHREDVSAFLIEARVIEAGQGDAEMVRELWSGILASVASRMGGKASPSGAGGAPGGGAEPCALGLGGARVRLSLSVEAGAGRTRSEPGNEARKEGRNRGPGGEPQQVAQAGPPAAVRHAAGNFDLLLEVELEATVRFGSREMELKELLELGPGDVVELDRQVADPVDLIVGDRIVARGEVVLVNGNFGLRVTEVAEPVRRLESIRCLW